MKTSLKFLSVMLFAMTLLGSNRADASQSFQFLFTMEGTANYIYVVSDTELQNDHSYGFRLFYGPLKAMKEYLVLSSQVYRDGGTVEIVLANGEKFFTPSRYDTKLKPAFTSLSQKVLPLKEVSEHEIAMVLDMMKVVPQEVIYEMTIDSLSGKFELPLDVEWGFKYLSADNHEGELSKECVIDQNIPASIRTFCKPIQFSTSISGTGLEIESGVRLKYSQVYSKTNGYGIAGHSDRFKNCYMELLAKPVGSVCKSIQITDEDVVYNLAIKKISQK